MFDEFMEQSRFKPKMRKALRLVVVVGKKQAEAARSAGISRQQVNYGVSKWRQFIADRAN